MKVILKKNHKNLGSVGEIKDVREGYARNFLIPQGIAELFTPNTQRQLESRKARLRPLDFGGQAQKEHEKHIANALSKQIFNISARANKEQHLFAKINTTQIQKVLQEHGMVVDVNSITIENSIKSLGKAEAVYTTAAGEKIIIKLHIVPA